MSNMVFCTNVKYHRLKVLNILQILGLSEWINGLMVYTVLEPFKVTIHLFMTEGSQHKADKEAF